ncbi:MAG: hypothetical protein ACREMQ_22020, partial [Longimicrobiales bacterium]
MKTADAWMDPSNRTGRGVIIDASGKSEHPNTRKHKPRSKIKVVESARKTGRFKVGRTLTGEGVARLLYR